MRADPTGLPALAVLATGFVAFLAALVWTRLRAGRERATGSARSRRSLLGIVLQGLAFVAVGIGRQRVVLDPLSAAALIQAIAVAAALVAALALFLWATRTMGRNWSLVARMRAEHQLVRTGPFAYVRHPIYSALVLVLVAIAVALGHAAQLWAAVPLYALGTWLRVAEEERLLAATFGVEHAAYARRVKRFVPRVF